MMHLTVEQVSRCCDNQVGADESPAVQAHLAACPECCATVEFQRLVECCAKGMHDEPSFDFTDVIMRADMPAPRRSSLSPLLHNVPAIVMGVSVVAIGIIGVFAHPSRGTGSMPGAHILDQVMNFIGIGTSALGAMAHNPLAVTVLFAAFTISLYAGIDRAIAHRRIG
jgi:anti-sigma factor RsiW